MKITTFEKLLKLNIQILEPSGYGSWRGSYSIPAIYFSNNLSNGKYVPISNIKEILEDLFDENKIFTAYKGDKVKFYKEDNEIYLETDCRSVEANSIFNYLHPDSIKTLSKILSEEEMIDLSEEGYYNLSYFDFEVFL